MKIEIENLEEFEYAGCEEHKFYINGKLAGHIESGFDIEITLYKDYDESEEEFIIDRIYNKLEGK
jgi:hypothetical protein